MFDVLPNLISSIITVLFPIFASYKALRTSDPAQLTPWLMYWVVFSCFTLFESWTWFILSWLPFYAYLRLFLLSYLVLPQTQGARLLYQSHIHPFIAHHEADIDAFITNAHNHARSASIQYLKRAIDFIKENFFGLQPKAQTHAPAGRSDVSYSQNLLSRFNLPSAREGLAAPAGDFYGLLSVAMGSSLRSGTNREAHVDEMSASGMLIPQGITGSVEKMTFLSQQREKLRVLLSALDKEAQHLETEDGIERDVSTRLGEEKGMDGGLSKSRSEAEFEAIDRDEANLQPGAGSNNRGSQGGWMDWAWGAKPTAKA